MREIFPFKKSDCSGAPKEYGSSNEYETVEGGNMAKQTHLHEAEDWGESDNINLLYQNNTDQQERQVLPSSGFASLDNLCSDVVSSACQLCQEEHTKLNNIDSEFSELLAPNEGESNAYSSVSFGLLKNRGSNSRQWDGGDKVNVPSHDTACNKVGDRKLSTNEIIRLAGEKFIKSSSVRVDDLSELSHPFSTSFVCLSDEEHREVDAIQHLLASAQKVGEQQFDLAKKFLNHCDEYSSNKGNPIQRLVYYFCAALGDRINQETGSIISKGWGKMKSDEIEEAMMSPNHPTILNFYEKVPFCQVHSFSGTQAIIENVAGANKIHIIDLEIRSGLQCTNFIQALADRHECPVEHLKITALGTKSKALIEETGVQLINFAQSMNLSFSFSVVMVADMLDLDENLFEQDDDEVVAVYSAHFLNTMIGRQDKLECLMRVIRSMNPCVMVVTEVEANHNSTVFVNRFVESLFYFGAFFDCLVDCMDPDDPSRMITESMYFGQAIQNIVAADGEERTIRHVKSNVWRSFFTRFKMVQKELSTSSLYLASFATKNFACESSFSLDMDGRTLIVGWKGTPILSLSAWKFI